MVLLGHVLTGLVFVCFPCCVSVALPWFETLQGVLTVFEVTLAGGIGGWGWVKHWDKGVFLWDNLVEDAASISNLKLKREVDKVEQLKVSIV